MNPLSGVLGEAWQMYKAFARHLLAIAFVIYLIAAVIAALLGLAGGFIGTLLGSLVGIVAAYLLQAALVKAVQDVRDGRADLSIGETVRAATPFLAPVIGASLLAGIAITIGLILIIVPGLYLITIWAVIVPVIVLEGAGVFDAFGRSHQLVRGRGWHVFGTLVLTWIILLVVNLVLGAIFVALPNALSNGLSSVISGTLVAPFIALVVTLVYYRLTATSVDPVPPVAGYGGNQQMLWPVRATASGLPDGQTVRQAAVFRPAPPSGRGRTGSLCPDRGGPVLLQVRYQVHRALVREEQPRAVHRDQAGRARNGVPQPAGPGDVEELVPGTPHQQGGHGQLPQARRDRGQVAVVERGQQPLEVPGALDRAVPRFQVGADNRRVDPLQVLVSGAEGDLGRGAGIGEHRDGGRRQLARGRELD